MSQMTRYLLDRELQRTAQQEELNRNLLKAVSNICDKYVASKYYAEAQAEIDKAIHNTRVKV